MIEQEKGCADADHKKVMKEEEKNCIHKRQLERNRAWKFYQMKRDGGQEEHYNHAAMKKESLATPVPIAEGITPLFF